MAIVNILVLALYFFMYIKSWNKVYNQMLMENLKYIHIGRARGVFKDDVIFLT